MIEVPVLIGRFQPFTLGHLKAYEYARQATGMPPVIALVVRTRGTRDASSPFSLLLREEVILATIPDAKIVWVRSLHPDHVREVIPQPIYVIGSDRAEAVSAMGVKYVEVPRTDEDISATKFRTLLADNLEDAGLLLHPNARHLLHRLRNEQGAVGRMSKDSR